MVKGRYSHPGLAALRQEAGVSIEQIMNATKLSRSFVTAIDEGEYDKLPGGIFTISYIRQFAAAIGQDGDAILDEIICSYEGAAGAPRARGEVEPNLAARWARLFSF